MPAAILRILVAAAGALRALSGAAADASLEKGSCEFLHEPLFPGYFWDPSCEVGKEGCLADGKNAECRFCGGGGYGTPCPPSSCHFSGGDPFVPYYWDPSCELGVLGCWADGIHAQCRFCGEYPYTSVPCPERLAAAPQGVACSFPEEPETPHFWDPACKEGMHGCLADGVHEQCRYCGGGIYVDIPCPASDVCSFANEPTLPYYWDPDCAVGELGCMADGVHPECRFCAKRPFEGIACPEQVAPSKGKCSWPLHSEPLVPFYWEPLCEIGKLGCWADGIHASCRFCGDGVFENISCPEGTDFPSPSPSPSPASLATSGSTSAVQGIGNAGEQASPDSTRMSSTTSPDSPKGEAEAMGSAEVDRTGSGGQHMGGSALAVGGAAKDLQVSVEASFATNDTEVDELEGTQSRQWSYSALGVAAASLVLTSTLASGFM